MRNSRLSILSIAAMLAVSAVPATPSRLRHSILDYPGIRTAALAIAHDNGMINRDCTEANFFARANTALEGYSTDDIIGIDIVLSGLTALQIGRLCAGEEHEQREVLAGNSYAALIHQLLENIFDA